NSHHIKNLIDSHRELRASSTLLVRHVKDPRQFGVASGKSGKNNTIEIDNLEEKPAKPSTNLAIMPVYIFEPEIFRALEMTHAGKSNELQLTDGIMKLVELGKRVIAIKMKRDDLWIDIGTPNTYWDALRTSYSLR
ncbi:MAG: sugar phosphate nucleotidyltransferase, partial [Thermoproteota archaeon]